MIRADHLIAIRNVGARTEKQRTIILHVPEEVIRISGHDLDVFRGDAVCLPYHLLIGVAYDHLAVIAPRNGGELRSGKDREQALHLGNGLARETLGVGEKDGWRIESVFGLTEEIRRANLAIDSFIGDNE